MHKPPQQIVADARHIAAANRLAIVEKPTTKGPAWIVYRRVGGTTIRLGRRSDPARLLGYVKRLATKPLKPNPVPGRPTQLIKCVWGLGRHAPSIDLTLCETDPTLMSMDAPNSFPPAAPSAKNTSVTMSSGTRRAPTTPFEQPSYKDNIMIINVIAEGAEAMKEAA